MRYKLTCQLGLRLLALRIRNLQIEEASDLCIGPGEGSVLVAADALRSNRPRNI